MARGQKRWCRSIDGIGGGEEREAGGGTARAEMARTRVGPEELVTALQTGDQAMLRQLWSHGRWVDGQRDDPATLAATRARIQINQDGKPMDGTVVQFRKSRLFGTSAHVIIFGSGPDTAVRKVRCSHRTIVDSSTAH